MKKIFTVITLFLVLVGSVFAKTTKVGEKQYHIENNSLDAVYEVISETEALILSNTLFNTVGMPLIVENNTGIDSEVASLTKKFGYTVYHDNVCVVINVYNKNTGSIDTIVWA